MLDMESYLPNKQRMVIFFGGLNTRILKIKGEVFSMRNSRILLAALVVLLAVPVLAQVPTGSIAGTVLDPTGAAIPGAEVTIISEGTGARHKLTTSSTGFFLVPSLQAGLYTVQVTAPGFRTAARTGIKVNAGTQYSVPPIKLEIGAVAETVTVEAGAELVQTTNAEVTGTVEKKQIDELPILDRNPLNLLNLQAGVANSGPGGDVITTIYGQRSSYTSVTLDGINIQDNFIRSNDLDFLPNRPLLSQVQEFTVTSQNSNTAAGLGSSQVSFITPSGTNEFHGEVFWQHRNNKVAANDWFNNAAGRDPVTGELNTPKPKLIQNQGGFGIGGPVIKEKLFAYGWYEIFERRQQTSQLTTVLTPNARNGIFGYDDAGTVRQVDILALAGVSIDPVIASLLARVPTTINDFGTGDCADAADVAAGSCNTAGFRFNQGQNQSRDNWGVKIDYIPSPKHSVAVTYAWNDSGTDRPDIDNTFNKKPVVQTTSNIPFMSAAYRWSPSARLTNEVRVGFSYNDPVFSTTEDFSAGFVIDAGTIFTNPIEDFRRQGRDTTNWSIQDNASYTLGNHNFTFGFLSQRIWAVPFSCFACPEPDFAIGLSPVNPAGFIAGDPAFPGASGSDISVANDLLASLAGFIEDGELEFNVTSRTSGFVPGAEERRTITLNNYSLYFGDSWRLRPNFTLNYGLRWEYIGRFDEDDGLFLAPVYPSFTTQGAVSTLLDRNTTLDFVGGDSGRIIHDKDFSNFAPQIGFAWDPWGNGRTSVRAGYSIHYVNDEAIRSADNAIGANAGLRTFVDSGPLAITASQIPSFTFPQPTFLVPRTLQDNFDDAGGFPDTVFTVDPELITPYVQQWNLSIQRDIGWNTSVTVSYIGNHGVHLTRAFDFNQVIIGPNGFLADFQRPRANGFLCEAAGLGFDPECTLAGSQTLTVFPNLLFGPLFFIPFLADRVRTGEPGDLAAIYHFNALQGSVQLVPNDLAAVADLLTNYSTSTYHGGMVEVRRRFARGLYFQSNYTFSKVLTDASGTGQTNFDPFLDFANQSLEKSVAEFDFAHVFKSNFVYQLPLGPGHSLSSGSSVINKLIDGWNIASIFVWQIGEPFSILSERGTLNRRGRSTNKNTAFTPGDPGSVGSQVGLFRTADGVFVINPAIIGDDGRGRGDESLGCTPTLNGGGAALFCNPGPGTLGNLARRQFNGPTYFNWDFSIFKKTEITETTAVEFRAEFFNFPNHPTFFSGNTSSDPNQNINNTNFGKMIRTVSTERRIQFGLKFIF